VARPKPRPRRERTDAELDELAKWPDKAHEVWKSLSDNEQQAVMDHMTTRYGLVFAEQFLDFTKSGARHDWSTYGGPFPEYTKEWFEKRGYKLVQQDSFNQWWAHPSGHGMVGQFGELGAKRAAEIAKQSAGSADQKAYNDAIDKADKDSEAIDHARTEIQGMENYNGPHVTIDPSQYDLYVRRLKDMKRQAEAQEAETKRVRDQFATKAIDTSDFDQLIDKLQRRIDWVNRRLEPDNPEDFAPRDPSDDPDLPPDSD
jgi:hypothetical protein